MDVVEDLWRLTKTALGKEKMFGYKSQFANQLYLICFITGRFFVDKTIRPRTRIALIIYLVCGLGVGSYIVISCILFGDKKNVQLMLSIGYAGPVTALSFIIEPLFSVYFFGDNLVAAVQMVDDIEIKRGNRKKLENLIDLERATIWIILSEGISCAFLFFFSPIVMVLYYEPEKTRDFNYYVGYTGNIEEWGSLWYFYVNNMLLPSIGTATFFMWISPSVLCALFAGFSYNEALCIADQLSSFESEADKVTTVEMYNSEIDPKFRSTLETCVHDYNELTRLVDNFKGFYTAFSGCLIPFIFVIELSHVINIVLPGTSTIVRIKEAGAFITSIIPLFVFCWAGDALREMAFIISNAVYSLPWYWSTTHRQNVYVLLIQTQVPTEQKALGVYPVELPTFLRVLNVINSTVNLLRSVAFT